MGGGWGAGESWAVGRIVSRGRGARLLLGTVLAKRSPPARLASVHPLPRARPTDAALAGAAMAGEPAAAGIVWERFSPLVRGLIRRSLGPEGDVEDHVQDVFLRFFEQVGELRDPAAVRSFLVGITVRVLRGELRRRRVRRWLRLTDAGEMPDAPAPPGDDDAREALRRLYRLLDGIEDDARLAFALRFVEGLELTEVAASLGASLATTKRRLAKVSARVLAAAKNDPVLVGYLALAPGESDAS